MLSTSITVHNADDSSIEVNSSEEFKVKDLGATTAKFLDGSVTAGKLVALNYSLSSSSGNFSTSNTTFTDVTNLSVSITTNGRLVMIALISDSSGNPTSFHTTATSGADFLIIRDSTEIARGLIGGTSGTTWDSTARSFFQPDSPSAGTYTYKIQIKSNSGSANTYMSYFKLVAYEL